MSPPTGEFDAGSTQKRTISRLSRHFKRLLVDYATAVRGRIFFVYGMRRSGNHAFIPWLINALNGQTTELVSDGRQHRFKRAADGSVYFVNELNVIRPADYRRHMWRARALLRRAHHLILSVEDEDDAYMHSWRIPSRAEVICVRRRPLNLMASRYQYLQQSARRGRGQNDFTMENRFFDRLERITHNPRGHVWQFEDWVSDPQWRQRFLNDLNLGADIAPGMASAGGGSSFSGVSQRPGFEELNARFRQVEPSRYWKEFLQQVVDARPALFSAAERQTIGAFLDGHTGAPVVKRRAHFRLGK